MNKFKTLLTDLFLNAVDIAKAKHCMPEYLRRIDASNGVCVLGAGKASVEMAQVAVDYFGDNCYGKIVTRHGYTEKNAVGNIEILKSSHPVPDEHSEAAAKAILQLAKDTPKDIPVLFLISGGGSALMSLPIDGLTFEEKVLINRFLLASGASIDEINHVRKKLSAIKGGKLANAVKGQCHTLVISDVVGDSPSLIASGPTIVDDEPNNLDAIEILKKYDFAELEKIKPLLERQHDQLIMHEGVTFSRYDIIANANKSIDRAREKAQEMGWHCEVLDYQLQGEAKEIAVKHAQIALNRLAEGKPVILLSGGELTVTINNPHGVGGPNQEYLLSLAIALNGHENIYALACDTDGVDGNKDVAGAFISSNTLLRAKTLGLDPVDHLKNNKSYDFFHQLDDLIDIGPTHTNVNDFRAILICADR